MPVLTTFRNVYGRHVHISVYSVSLMLRGLFANMTHVAGFNKF